ncbi:site-specific integrase [Aurantimonas sp. C2-5-R2]|uniref:tyrosine-type recombinase/integrase n=1 Tax=Aurantimonas sp. C2-5-R2 TaxID=3113713 RepID=UPI002F9462D6
MAVIKKRIWTNKGGTHEAWKLDYIDANGVRHREQFAKKRDAEARRVEVEGQIGKGTYRAEAANTTVRKACEDFDRHLEGRMNRGERVTPLYYTNATAHMWNYIAPKAGRKNKIQFDGGIGDVKLAQLTARGVGEFRDRLRDSGVGIATTRQILGTLSRVLLHAVANDLVAVNVAGGVRVIGKRNEGAKKIVPPSKEEMASILGAADQDFRVRIVFAAASGLRASELHALRWSRIDLNKGEVTVETRVDAKRNEDTTKSAAGLRAVPLGSSVVTAMKEWRLRSKFAKDDDLVFPNSRGDFESHNNMLKRRFKPTLERAAAKFREKKKKLTPFGWHSLRHFAVSTWIEAGLQPKTVQTFAGHSSLAVTMDRYGHLFPSEDHRRTMDKIASSIFA